MKIYFFTNRKKAVKAHSIVISWLETHEHEVKFELLNTKKGKAVKVDDFDVVILEMDKNDKVIYKTVFDALMKNKPVLLLYEYHARKPRDLVFPMEKTMLKYLIIRGYVAGNLQEVLEKFFINLEKGRLERFNFFISKDIEEYLNWIPYSSARTRSDFIRGLIKDEMKKDEKYGKYQSKNQEIKKSRNHRNV